MVLTGVTFLGPETHDARTLERLPPPLRELLTEVNGFVAYRGGLHLRLALLLLLRLALLARQCRPF